MARWLYIGSSNLTQSLNRLGSYLASRHSVGGGEAWSLSWEWGSLASVETGAPSTSLAHSGASALPGLGALLGTLPVVRLGDGAVLVIWVSGSVLGPVSTPELLGVVVVLSVGWDNGVTESNSWWGTGEVNEGDLVVVVSGLNGGEQSSDGKEFHNNS